MSRLTPRLTVILALAIAANLFAARSAAAQNADNGRQVLKQACGICHEVAAGKNRVGPSLFGVVGRKAGSAPDFHYSDEMKNAGLVWDDATLDRFLTAPRATVPGTRMAYAGMKDDQKRHDLIAYLATLH
jgi:cytochrome c